MPLKFNFTEFHKTQLLGFPKTLKESQNSKICVDKKLRNSRKVMCLIFLILRKYLLHFS